MGSLLIKICSGQGIGAYLSNPPKCPKKLHVKNSQVQAEYLALSYPFPYLIVN